VTCALITGVLGQDGSLLAEYLLTRSYRVVGVDRPGTPLDADRAPLASRCELLEVDLEAFDAAALVDRVKPDEIYHLAACHRASDQPEDDALRDRMMLVNHDATLALAHAQRGRGSIVVACSRQMYQPALPELRIDEQTPHAPATHYGVTKANCRNGIRALRDKGLRGSCAILFNHESTRRSPAFVTRKITQAATRIAAKRETTLELGDLSARVDFSAATDVVRALHLMATASQPGDRVIASGTLHSLADVCEVAFRAVGLDYREHVTSARPPGDRPALVGDPSLIERDGWTRERPFAAWIEEMVEADRQRL